MTSDERNNITMTGAANAGVGYMPPMLFSYVNILSTIC